MIAAVRDNKNISAFGLSFYDRVISSLLIAGSIENEPQRTNQNTKNFENAKIYSSPAVFVTGDFLTAKKAFEELECLSEDVVYLPAKDDVLTYALKQAGENTQTRLKSLYKIADRRAKIIVTTADAIAQLYPKADSVVSHAIELKASEEYNLTALSKRLVSAGYKKVTQVENKAEFSLRGDILDIYPVNFDSGIRCEFFGDTLESIRPFDLSSQVGTGCIDYISVAPAVEVFFDDPQQIVKQLKSSLKENDEYYQRSLTLVSSLTLSLETGFYEGSLNFIMPLAERTTFFDFCSPGIVFYDDAKSIWDNLNAIYTEFENRYKTLLARGEALKFSCNQLIEKEDVFSFRCVKIAYHRLTSQNRIFEPEAVFNFNSREIGSYSKDFTSLAVDVKNWQENGFKVYIFAGDDGLKERISEFFNENRVGYSFNYNGSICLTSDNLHFGAVFFEQKKVLIGRFNLVSKPTKKALKRSRGDIFNAPEVGDYVVHALHGIGKIESITRMEVFGAKRDYFVVGYAGGDKLYEPIENLDALAKYVGEKPKLSKIGGAEFARVKAKVRASVKAMAFDLVKLYAEREKIGGYKYDGDEMLLKEFSDSFPYIETEDQITAIEEGLNDLRQGKVMDRLLCGDVGYGKTEVALRLAFKVIAEGKQVAFISPTTILARQHYNTVMARMTSFGVSVGSLTRFDNDKDVQKTISGLVSGSVDIVCGTHRVLSKDVVFKDLGLLILDEEQRFGVADKEKIKNIKKNVNVLSLSATPIPRTLHLSMVGIRDISVLDTPPADRIPVQTFVTEFSEGLCFDAIMREVNRGGQVFVVYNRVASIDSFAFNLSKIVPDVKILVGHGQMSENRLENVIKEFVAGEADVLVASTIIENGIDMPNANTMIIVDADKMGLSQLYQLRGRVGRSNRLAYVYVTFEASKSLTESAYKRLDAIAEYTEFGSGFKIAMKDLEIRGAGNILGAEQHGHIENVGYDLYCKLLGDAVKELEGKEVEAEAREVKVVTDFNAFVPSDYIADEEWRMRLYSKISKLESAEARESLLLELFDIYGKPPDSVCNLLTVALIKNLAQKINASIVTLKKSEVYLSFSKVIDIPERAFTLVGRHFGKFETKSARLNFSGNSKAAANMLNFLSNCHKNYP